MPGIIADLPQPVKPLCGNGALLSVMSYARQKKKNEINGKQKWNLLGDGPVALCPHSVVIHSSPVTRAWSFSLLEEELLCVAAAMSGLRSDVWGRKDAVGLPGPGGGGPPRLRPSQIPSGLELSSLEVPGR